MPLYEFVCLACEATFDARKDPGADDPACPACGAGRVRRRFSLFAAPGGSSGAGVADRGASAGGGCACGGACACGGH